MEKTKKDKAQKEQVFEIEKTKFFWLYWVLATCCLVLGVFLLPVWTNTSVFWRNWATEGIGIMLFIMLAVYIIYLIGMIEKDDVKGKKAIKITEVSLLAVLAIFCILEQFDVVNFIGPCFVVGTVLWLRGISCALNAYLFTTKKKERTLAVMLWSLLAVSVGPIFMVRRFTAPVFIWIISIALILAAILLTIFGFIAKEEKKEQGQAEKK